MSPQEAVCRDILKSRDEEERLIGVTLTDVEADVCHLESLFTKAIQVRDIAGSILAFKLTS